MALHFIKCVKRKSMLFRERRMQKTINNNIKYFKDQNQVKTRDTEETKTILIVRLTTELSNSVTFSKILKIIFKSFTFK